jgi:hypothetical protein
VTDDDSVPTKSDPVPDERSPKPDQLKKRTKIGEGAAAMARLDHEFGCRAEPQDERKDRSSRA